MPETKSVTLQRPLLIAGVAPLASHVEIYSDQIRWRSRGLANNNKMNHLDPGLFPNFWN